MSTASDEQYRTLEGLQQHPLFQALTRKQQIFIVAYIELGGDRIAAVRKAYGENKADQTAMRLLRSPIIRQLFGIYYGYEADQVTMSRAELAGLISARLRKSDLSDRTFAQLAEVLTELAFRKGHVKRGRPRKEEDEQNIVATEKHLDELVREIEEAKRRAVKTSSPNSAKETQNG